MTTAWTWLALAAVVQGGTVIDQIAVVAGKHAIKTSDIDRDLRVTEFLNGDPPDDRLAQRRKSASRLIDQELIREDIAARGNTTPAPGDAGAVLDQLLHDRFQGSQARLSADLAKRGLTEAQVKEELQWQLVVLRFIDQRFRPEAAVSDDDVRQYYQQHSAELQRRNPKMSSLAAAAPAIRKQLEGDRINQSFEQWLQQARETASIQYKIEALK